MTSKENNNRSSKGKNENGKLSSIAGFLARAWGEGRGSSAGRPPIESTNGGGNGGIAKPQPQLQLQPQPQPQPTSSYVAAASAASAAAAFDSSDDEEQVARLQTIRQRRQTPPPDLASPHSTKEESESVSLHVLRTKNQARRLSPEKLISLSTITTDKNKLGVGWGNDDDDDDSSWPEEKENNKDCNKSNNYDDDDGDHSATSDDTFDAPKKIMLPSSSSSSFEKASKAPFVATENNKGNHASTSTSTTYISAGISSSSSSRGVDSTSDSTTGRSAFQQNSNTATSTTEEEEHILGLGDDDGPSTMLMDDNDDTATIVDDDDDDDEDGVSTLRLLDFYQSHCWKCNVTLQFNNNNHKKHQQFCLYALHPHPLLQVPICSVCREEVWAMEQEITTTKAKKDDSVVIGCSGCGGTDNGENRNDDDDENDDDLSVIETFFLCDDCPRAFCQACLEKCHGGGASGEEIVHGLMDDEDKNWSCPFCQPPPPLLTLQSYYMEQRKMMENEQQPLRTIETIVSELQRVEQERDECEHQLLTHVLAEKRTQIRLELLVSHSEVEDAVEAEMRVWEKQWVKHDQRLADRVLLLQQEIEARGENLVGVYAAIRMQNDDTSTTHMLDSGTSGKDEPEWKKAADQEIRRRQEQEDDDEDYWLLQNPSDPSIYKKDIPEDVEDLGMFDPVENENGNKRSQWRHGRRRAKPEDIEEAMKEEDKLLQERRIPILLGSDDLIDNEDDNGNELIVVCRRESHGTSSKPTLPLQNKRARLSSPATARKPPEKKQKRYLAVVGELSGLNGISICDSLPDAPRSSDEGPLAESALVLKSPNSCSMAVSIAQPLVSKLKAHQVEGIHFIWNNSFADLGYKHDAPSDIVENVGGCILAHNMGLGKSLTCISLLQALMHNRLLKTVLLVAPTNVISHWENEIDKWTGSLPSPISVLSLGSVQIAARQQELNRWQKRGGVVLLSSTTFVALTKNDNFAGPLLNSDVVVVDEAHLMLRNSSKIMAALTRIKTCRRVALTGSPIQNNLKEYYSMVSWVRPGVLGNSESAFDREFDAPIMNGVASDAPASAVRVSNEVSKKLYELLAPYVLRKDATILLDDLPPMQQVVLVLRQTKTQSRLYRAFARYKQRNGINNFFTTYQMVRPIHNHPGTLLQCGVHLNESMGEDPIDVNMDGSGDNGRLPAHSQLVKKGGEWWRDTAERTGGAEKLKEVEKGYKVVLLLHILIEALSIGDKVLVFSQCLRTLDYLEYVLGLEDWFEHVPSLPSSSLKEGMKRGGWTKGRDYLRIDGTTQFSERGELIDKFNDNTTNSRGPHDEVKAFLLSSTAGGVGINLIAANRVVLFDSSFNPVIMTQAVFRSYRYGQTKPVFAYRLMTEGSVEEKIYSRGVNKSGIALRVIDNKTIARNFTQKELEDLEETDTWAQCDRCEKWRMLPFDANSTELPDQWFCEMNHGDALNNSCDATPKNNVWYELHRNNGQTNNSQESSIKCNSTTLGNADSALSNQENVELLEKDIILKKLLAVTAKDRTTAIVSKHYFHDSLLADVKDDPLTAAVAKSSNELTVNETPTDSHCTVNTTVSLAQGKEARKVSHLTCRKTMPPSAQKCSPVRAKGQESLQDWNSQSIVAISGSRKKDCSSRSCNEKKEVEEPSLPALLSGKSSSEAIEILSDSDDDDNDEVVVDC